MTREDLFDAITNVKDTFVNEAARFSPAPVRTKQRRARWGALAAAAALALGLGAWALHGFVRDNATSWDGLGGGVSGALSGPCLGGAAGGSGHQASSIFMSYAGPVLPLTALSGGDGLSAERHLLYDFSPWALERPSTNLLVTDEYILTNPTDAEKNVRLLYPFVGTLRELEELCPALTVDGAQTQPLLWAGGYPKLFFSDADTESGGLARDPALLESWEDYKALLADGRYQASALEPFADLSDTPVTVYEFTNAAAPAPDNDAGLTNPSIRAVFSLDYDKTTVLTYGFNGCSLDREAGTMLQNFSIPLPRDDGTDTPQTPCTLFVLGDDIADLVVEGIPTGSPDPDLAPLAGCSVDVRRSETDLEDALRTAAALMFSDWQMGMGEEGKSGTDSERGFALYFGLLKQYLLSDGPLAEGSAQHGEGWLEDIDVANTERVFYLETTVTVPAHGRAVVSAKMTKHASFDYACAGTDNQGISGFDMMTVLGSALDLSVQTAEAANTGAVEIVRQNYGFDWENGVYSVPLDPAWEHYYLEVRAR